MTKPIVQRFLLVVAIGAWTGCAGFQQARLGAPDGSYTPARLTVVIEGASETIDGAVVTPQFFTAEGVRPWLGRFFVEADYASGATGVAVLSQRFWEERFRSTPSVIGSRVEIDGRSTVIVGVAPQAFQPDRAGLLWIPKSS